MYSKIVLFLLIILITAFFYLHTENPTRVDFIIYKDYRYNLPVTALVFAGFFIGAVLAVVNTIFVDIRRAFFEMRVRREKKTLAQADEDYRSGVEALAREEYQKAARLIERAMKVKPSVDMYIRLAQALKGEGKFQDALRVLDRGLVKNPESLEILSAVARLHLEEGDTLRASKVLEGILKEDDDNLFALTALRDIRIEEGDWRSAAELQKRIVERGGTGRSAQEENALLYGLRYEVARRLFKEGRLDESVAELKEILRKDDSFVPAKILQGEIYLKNGDRDAAIKLWEEACRRLRHPEFFMRLEDLYLEDSRPNDVLDLYRKAVDENPTDIRLKLLLARLYLRLEMVDNAMEELERLGQETEEGLYHHVLLAEACLRRSQPERAARLLEQALGFGDDMSPPFECSHCGQRYLGWQAGCRRCGRWNTLEMKNIPVESIEEPALYRGTGA